MGLHAIEIKEYPSPNMKYIKQLDSLRAIAVLLVIISHWIHNVEVIDRTKIGEVGVNVFFVLSGFLITKILLDNTLKSKTSNISKLSILKNFYFRRTLRIFPIYYLTIVLLFIFSKTSGTDIKTSFLYFATYTSNFYLFKIQAWDGMISHLWSLAVEEQFYFIWPWIILFANKKYILPIIIGFISIGVISQYLTQEINMSSLLTFNCFDAFGIGALLSWQITFANEKLNRFYRITSVLLAASIFFYGFGILQKQWVFVPLRTCISVITLWIITYIILYRETNKLHFKFILNNRILIFLGKISYGLYLYHNIIPSTLNAKIINKYLNPLLPPVLNTKYLPTVMFVENAIMLIIIAWFSYILIEKPFLNLKKNFEYKEVDKNLKQSLVVSKII